MQNLSAPFILQEECRLKIAHVLFQSVFSKLRIRVSEGHFQCVHTIRIAEPTKIGSLKTDRVNGPSGSFCLHSPYTTSLRDFTLSSRIQSSRKIFKTSGIPLEFEYARFENFKTCQLNIYQFLHYLKVLFIRAVRLFYYSRPYQVISSRKWNKLTAT